MAENEIIANDFLYAESLLKKAYASFNVRDLDATISVMHPEVEWPNGMEGGIEHGHTAVRNYWTRQWKMINPRVDPLRFNKLQDGRIDVTVHQVVYDLNGKLLLDQTIHHIYTIEGGLIKCMEIKNA